VWVAHLAKSERSGGGRGPAETSCWMLVIATERHACWLDYLVHIWPEGAEAG